MSESPEPTKWAWVGNSEVSDGDDPDEHFGVGPFDTKDEASEYFLRHGDIMLDARVCKWVRATRPEGGRLDRGE